MIEKEKYIKGLEYHDLTLRDDLHLGSGWEAALRGADIILQDTVAYGEYHSSKDYLPEVIHITRVGGHWPRLIPEAESRPTTLEEAVLLIEAIPGALKKVRDGGSVYRYYQGREGKYGPDDLWMAQNLTERLMETVGKRLKDENLINRLSQVRELLVSEGLISKNVQT